MRTCALSTVRTIQTQLWIQNDWFLQRFGFFLFPVELISAVSDECLWGEVYNPLIIPAALKTSLSIGVWCETLIFQSTEHYIVFYIQSSANFDFSCRENGAAGSQSRYPENQEHTINSPCKNFRNALAEPVLKVVPDPFRIPPFSSTALGPIFHIPSNFCYKLGKEFIDSDHIIVQSWFISKAGPLSALKKMIIGGGGWGESCKDKTICSPWGQRKLATTTLILTFPAPVVIDFTIWMLLLYIFYVISCGFVFTLQWDMNKPGTFLCIKKPQLLN